MNQILNPTDYYSVYLDDIIIFSKDINSHLNHIVDVFRKLSKAGLKLKKSKCKFGLSEINYLGFIVSPDGVKPDKSKVEPILNWKIPSCTKELQSFLGVCAFYQKFIKNFAHIASPFYRLLRKSTPWSWSESCSNAFMEIKTKLSEIPSLYHPDWKLPFILHCDASDKAIGAVISQKNGQVEKPIAFYSRILNSAERQYSTLDKESLALVSAIKKFKYYLYGKKFFVYTDHNPLKYLKSIKNISGRRARWILDLEEYDFEIDHIPGSDNIVADGLSRSIAALQLESDICLHEVQKKDQKLLPVIQFLQNNIKEEKVNDAETNYLIEHSKQLSIINNLLCHRSRRGLRPVIPTSLRKQMFESCHSKSLSHLGMNKTIDLLSDIAYWPSMKTDVSTWISECQSCQLNKHRNRKPKSNLIPINTSPDVQFWEVDFMGPLPRTINDNQYIIVFINTFTKWVEALAVPDQSSSTAVKAMLECVVYRFGIPDRIHSDQGRHFEGDLFKGICKTMGIKKSRTTPYHPASNGNVERENRKIKEMLRHHVNSNQNDWDRHLSMVLFAIRSAQNASTKYSPAELTLGRKLKTPVALEFSKNIYQKYVKIPDGNAIFQKLVSTLHQTWNIASCNIKKAQELYKNNHDIISSENMYKPGDLVLTKTNGKNKLCNVFSGPHLVLESRHPVYKISDGKNLENYHLIHHDHLYPTQVDTFSPRGG
ncbi:Transposon Tf2-9 polyprotein [Thelohanellus kitauei]|nr:Transposon Tf2-9 polyprotein [Thelohanellus kitauei]